MMRRDPLPPDALDTIDRLLFNRLQEDFPLSPHPFREVGDAMGLSEQQVIDRISRLRDIGAMTRFGPFIDAEALGGAFCLCAIAVPEERFAEVAAQVNGHPEVAHNYERLHRLNMWFVLACDRPEDIKATARRIEEETRLRVLRFPKLKEFFIGFRVTA